MPEKEKLFEQFPPVSTEEWMNKIRADLKGQDFDRKLVWRSPEGFMVKPFYREEDNANLPYQDTPPGEFPFLRGIYPGKNEWYIRQDIKVDDPVKANKKALDVLNKGVTSLGFIFGEKTEYTASLMETLLNGIYCESIELNFRPQGDAKELLGALTDYLNDKGIKPSAIKGSVETDPLGRLMQNGKLCIPAEEAMDYLAGLVRSAESFNNLRLIAVNGAAFGNAGSNIVQELAFSLAMGNEYLSQLTGKGISADDAAGSIGFTFGTGSSYFMEIAKLRAARILWAKITEAYKPSSKDSCRIYIHSVTSDWNKTVYDPYVNMLRSQTEAMSASLGGTNSLTVRPFDIIFREPSEFSERIARNQQLLLMEESHFDKVNDPAAGSYYIENLTASIVEHAWELFIEVEDEGGFLAALKKGSIQEKVRSTADVRRANIRKRKEKLLGTNIFPNTLEKIQTGPVKGTGEGETDLDTEPLKAFRAAQEFEELRLSVDSLDRQPSVFLLKTGNPVMRTARAQFTQGFFGSAGYKIIDNAGFDNLQEGVEQALGEKADIVVVCSSDDEYADIIPEVNRLLAGRSILVVAGEPACMEDLRKEGVEHFISMRSNLYETLKEYNRELGINNSH